ncbi:MAG TPA: hypothetical protein VFQ61_08470, partial [Polyangiaceae bacterium]|nr:hypothetical protein [Polyangiaceae bacterium]
LEGSDMSLVHLWEAPAGSTWPSVTRLASSTLPANIVGQNIITYGRGMTTYATPPTGTTSGAGTWKSLSRTVASTRAFLGGTELIINAAANGNSIVGWGDSGSGSLLNNNIVSVTTSLISYECYDSSTSDRCKQTTTKISSAGLRSVSDFATYINEAPNRPLTWASPLTNIQSPWIQDRRLEYSSPDSNVVTLRGQLRREVQGTSKLFLLPSGLRPARRMYVPVPALSGEILSARLRIEADGWVYLQTADATPNQVSVHLDGVQFSVKTDGFEALDLANGWVPFGNTMFTPAARKVGNTVYLQGSLKHPSTPSSMIVFTLDAGLRPPADTYVPIVLCSSERGRLVIQPNGNVRIETENSDADPACLTSLDGVSFRISTAGTSAAAMQNGWTGGVFSTLPLSFVFDGPWVRFLGAVGNGTDSHIITLPAKYRPRSTQVLTADGCGAQKAWVTITTDGKVRAYSATNGLPSCFVSFSGVSFVP